jgi:hypothetical protein
MRNLGIARIANRQLPIPWANRCPAALIFRECSLPATCVVLRAAHSWNPTREAPVQSQDCFSFRWQQPASASVGTTISLSICSRCTNESAINVAERVKCRKDMSRVAHPGALILLCQRVTLPPSSFPPPQEACFLSAGSLPTGPCKARSDDNSASASKDEAGKKEG